MKSYILGSICLFCLLNNALLKAVISIDISALKKIHVLARIERYYFFYKTTPKNRVRMNRFNMDDTVVHENY